MGRLKLSASFTFKLYPIQQKLLDKPSSSSHDNGGFGGFVSLCLTRLNLQNGNRQNSRSEQEDKVYSWLYAIAQSDRSMAFEYVKSTERGLSFAEAERRIKEDGRNVPVEYTTSSRGLLLWNALCHPFNVILIVLSILSYLTYDDLNGCIMLVLVFISVSLRFYQEYSSTKAALKLSEFLRYPVKVPTVRRQSSSARSSNTD